jgi:hypothetical protein
MAQQEIQSIPVNIFSLSTFLPFSMIRALSSVKLGLYITESAFDPVDDVYISLKIGVQRASVLDPR